jgi:hypothetical protein
MKSNRIDPTAGEWGAHTRLVRAMGQGRPAFQHGPLCDPATLLTAALWGAAVGAVTAAVQGGNILKGALLGAIGGAIGSGLSAAFGGAAGGAGSKLATAAISQSMSSGAQTPEMPTGMPDGGSQEPVSDIGAANPGFGDGSAQEPIAPAAGPGAPAGEGLAANAPAIGLAADTGGSGIADSRFSTGFTDGGTAGGPADTSMAGNAAGGSAPTFFDGLMKRASGMMNNKALMDIGGRMLTGAATGNAQQKALEARAKEQEAARQNARFGNLPTRYNAAGMIYAPQTTYGKP